MTLELDVNTWAAEQFGACDLGDARRTARAVKMAAQFAANPSGSTPEQTETWGDCKAAYRLFDCGDVTPEGLATPHWKQTKARESGHYLLLGDTTIVSFDGERELSGLGIVTSGSAQGFLVHSSLMVTADRSHQVLGLAGQTIYYRQPVLQGETQLERLRRQRESEIWGQVIDQVGPPAEGVRFTHVFDRGGDNFEVYCHLLLQRTDWVVRAAQLTRTIVTPAGKQALGDYLQACPVAGTYELEVKANHHQPARTALVEVRLGLIGLPIPRDHGRFAEECGITFIAMYAVEVREVNPPKGAEPLRWVLLTSHAVTTFEEALEVITYYEQRPLIEEFHKALKTGCRLEDRLYETAPRWEAVTAMLSIVAVRLLQLKTVAQAEPNRPAEAMVPPKWIVMLSAVRKGRNKQIRTAYEFMRALAGLGGHLGRKRDGEPGWITLWRGFNKLHLLLRGAAAMNQKCG